MTKSEIVDLKDTIRYLEEQEKIYRGEIEKWSRLESHENDVNLKEHFQILSNAVQMHLTDCYKELEELESKITDIKTIKSKCLNCGASLVRNLDNNCNSFVELKDIVMKHMMLYDEIEDCLVNAHDIEEFVELTSELRKTMYSNIGYRFIKLLKE